jgi:hypothetical protein
MKGTIVAPRLLAIAAIAGLALSSTAGEQCPPAGGLNFICGPVSVEDLVRVPGTHWIIGSGMTENGHPGRLHLIDADKQTWETFYPGQNPQNALDAESYPSCPGAPDTTTFGAHGIAIRDDGNRTSTLLAVNHGREAVEVFKVDAAGTKPSVRWVGCVPMDESIYLNSVAFLPGGGFVATKFYDRKAPEGFGAILARKITGGVLEWHPETGVRAIAGTDLTGANGIVVSKDGRSLYVAAWGTQELVRFLRRDGAVEKKVVTVDFWPDNLRWAPDGTILVTGQHLLVSATGGFSGSKGWTVAKIDPETLEVAEILKDHGESPLQNASVAIDVDGALWIGQFLGNRIGYKTVR